MFLGKPLMQVLNGKNLIEFREFQLDADKSFLRRDGEIVSLPLKAVEVLRVLIENRGDVVTKDELMSRVWAGAFVEDSVLTQNIYLLRKTLNTNGSKGLIKTVPRRGYLFDGEVLNCGERGATVIERHSVERISLDVEEGRGNKKSRRPFGVAALAAIGLVVTLVAVGAYFFTRDESRVSIPATPPLRLKPMTAASGYKTLAVLPFNGSDTSFARSFSNDLSIRLGAMNKFAIKTPALLDEYARHDAEAKTDFVMRGEAAAENGRYRASVNFALADGSEIWSDTFEFDNLVQLQDAVANRTAKEITARLSPSETELVSKRLPSNTSAYESFQRGYVLWRNRADGVAYLNKAIEMDQSFAPAYAILASNFAMGGTKDSPPAVEAEKLLQKAFSLDENLPDAYAVQGFMRMFHHHDWPGAEVSLKSALELDPNNVNARHWLGVYYSIHRRLDEAKAEMAIALELDPTNPTLLADLGQLHYFAGEKDVAVAYCERALALEPNHSFAINYSASFRLEPDDAAATMQRLEDSHAERQFASPYLNVDPKYDSIRKDKRFTDLLAHMNLPWDSNR